MNFFVLRSPKAGETATDTDFLSLEDSATGEAPRCPVCGSCVGMLPLLPPVRVELETWGTHFGDINIGTANELFVTDIFWDIYKTSSLTGLLEVGPAEVVKVIAHKKLHQSAPQYRYCRVTRSRAAIDDVKSGLERDEPQTCNECRLGGIIKRTKRVVIEHGSWSGEDIFIARGLPGTIVVSEKFHEFFSQNRISGCLLTRAEEYSFDFYPWEKKERGSTEPDSRN